MELKRELKLLDVFCIATGAMISSGLFVLPGLAYALTGPSVIISYLLAGLLAMTGMFSQAELVSAMPKAGGTYFYVTRSMGPALGTIDGLITWMSISLKSSFALIGMAAFMNIILPYDPHITAILLCLFFIFVNFVGIKEAGKFQVFLVALLLLILFVYIGWGLSAVKPSNLEPFMPKGMPAVFSVAGFVFVSYGGLLKVASIAEEVKNPGKTVPLGMILSLITVGIFYTLAVLVTAGVLGPEKLSGSLTPITDGANVFMGNTGGIILSIAAILAFVSTANAGIMSASRYPLALSRDHLLPPMFANLHKKYKTPFVAIFFTGIFMILVLFLDVYFLVEVASTVLIFTFIFSCICVIIMRESGVQNYRPRFKSPLYPWVQIAGIFGCWLLVINMGKQALFMGSLLFAAGAAVFWFYGRKRVQKDYALLHLIERVAAREFVDVSLESELKEIILERDDIIKDRFDEIIEKSTVLDIEEAMTMEEFFDTASEKMSRDIGVDASVIKELLLIREKQVCTVMIPGLAIPHIVVEGEHTFSILLARNKTGIKFPEDAGVVNMVFLIAGTKDERPFHLRALSAIAQIVEDPKFMERWMNAKDAQDLRDIVLLGKRKRSS